MQQQANKSKDWSICRTLTVYQIVDLQQISRSLLQQTCYDSEYTFKLLLSNPNMLLRIIKECYNAIKITQYVIISVYQINMELAFYVYIMQ